MALARARSVLVVSVASAAVVVTASWATAHDGDDVEGVHGCVSQPSGQLRVLSHPGGSCRSGETPLHLSTEAGDDGAVEALRTQLAAPDEGSELVHWSNLGGVPQDVTGLGDFMAGLAVGDGTAGDTVGLVHWSALLGMPAVLADGVIGIDEVVGDVGSAHLADGSVSTVDLAGAYVDGAEHVRGAVTSEKLADGTVEARDLADGAVTAGKLALSAASSHTASAALMHATRTPAVPPVVLASAGDRVLVSGQTQFSCSCTDPASRMDVQYQLVRLSEPGSVAPHEDPVSPTYTVTLTNLNPTAIVPITLLDHVTRDGDTAYQIAYVQTIVGGPAVALELTGTAVGAVNLG